MVSITKRWCPVCGSSEKTMLVNINFELFDGHPMNGGYDLVQCAACGFVFANTSVTQAQLDQYYKDLSKYEDKVMATGGGHDENDRKRLVDTAKFIASHLDNMEISIVDLGCSNGGLLKELKSLGYSNLTGIDPSEACVKNTIADVNCHCFQYSLFDIPADLGKYNVVVLTHVLEHLLDVKKAIAIVENLLLPNGLVYIECPNAGYYKEVIHAPLQEFNAEHINHFTETAFKNLMALHGFKNLETGDKVFKISSNQDYHSVFGIYQKAEGVEHEMQYDNAIREEIEEYISKSNLIFDRIKAIITQMPKEKPIGLFGMGQFSFKLLKTDAFQNFGNIRLFDNNRLNVGKKISGTPILHGSQLMDEYRKEPFIIVITSLIHETAIRKSILAQFEAAGEKLPHIVGFGETLD